MTGEAKALFELGKQLLKEYGKSSITSVKRDGSPLTNADLFSHQFLTSYLKSIEDLPILSEENVMAYEERMLWKRFWMIDPLDGTKAYLAGKGDFAVNIALIENNIPIKAWILSPIRKTLYYAKKGEGAYSMASSGESHPLLAGFQKNISLFHSYSHEGKGLDKILSKFPSHCAIALSSSIKFCLVAETEPSCYIRLAGSSEWDTAAGDCILRESGGSIHALEEGTPLAYNKPSLRNPSFIAFSQSFCKSTGLSLIKKIKEE